MSKAFATFFLLLSCVAGWVVITEIPENMLTAFICVPLVYCIFCFWLVIFENNAVKFRPYFRSFPFLSGSFVPILSNWTKPIKTSIFVILAFCCALFILGGLLKVFWVLINA